MRFLKRRLAPVVLIAFLICTVMAGPAAAEPEVRLTTYFTLSTEDQFYLVPVELSVPQTARRAEKALELLISGPPAGGPLYGLLPKNTRLLGYRLENGTAYVDFSREIMEANVGSSGEALLIDSIVLTLAEFPGVKRVQILVEGKQPGSIGGHIEITGPISTENAYQRSRFMGFADAAGHWAEGEITALYAAGILAGFPGGGFRPEDTVTRAQFVKMAVKAAGIEEPRGGAAPGGASGVMVGFTDVPAGAWYWSYLEASVGHGIVVPGDYGGVFGADTPITRREVAIMLVRARELEQQAADRRGASLPFADTTSQPDWAKGYLAVALEQGLIKGYPGGTFRPYGHLTRAEAAAVISRFMGLGGPNVFLLAPAGGSRVKDRVLVFGVARVFEAAMEVRLKDGDRVVRQVFTTATEGAPGWGAYAAILNIPSGASGTLTVEALTHSPKDGSEQDVISRQVSVER
ncbi:MAG: hypothetical protein HPY55_13815 [Firmicutes bacterium]|nr:hypothetical protein [Bacillota bacterium]